MTAAPLLLAAQFLTGSATLAGPGANPGPPAVTFAGRVVTPAGGPAAGARVLLGEYRDGAFAETVAVTAGPDGRFALTHPDARELARSHMNLKYGRGLVAVPAGWGGPGEPVEPGDEPLAPGLLPVPPPLPGRVCEVGDLPLSPGTVYAGRVTDAAGNPVAGAVVDVSCAARYQASTVSAVLPGARAVSGADGRFVTPPLPVCEVSLTVAADGFRTASPPVEPAGFAAAVTLRPIVLESELPTVLEVVDESGAPAAGVTVKAYPGYEPRLTGPDGRVLLHGLGPGDPVDARVSGPAVRSAARFRPEPADPLPTGERLFRTTITADRLLSFAVTDAATGDPVTVDSVVLCAWEPGPDGKPRLTGCMTPDLRQPVPGAVSIPHAGPDAYHLAIAADGYVTADLFLDPFAEDGDRTVGPFALVPLGPGGGEEEVPNAAAGPFGALDESVVSGTVSGVVAATGGADPAGALVTLWTPPRPSRDGPNVALTFGRRAPDPGTCVAAVVADGAGRFSLTVPRTGDHLLRADCAPAGGEGGIEIEEVTPATRPAPAVAGVTVAGVTVAAGEELAVTLSPPVGGSLAGRLAFRGLTPGPAWAVAFDGAHLLRAVPVAADGAFRFVRRPAAGRVRGEGRPARRGGPGGVRRAGPSGVGVGGVGGRGVRRRPVAAGLAGDGRTGRDRRGGGRADGLTAAGSGVGAAGRVNLGHDRPLFRPPPAPFPRPEAHPGGGSTADLSPSVP